MQMHPLPLLLCSPLFNHENNSPSLSFSIFLATFNRDRETESSSSFLPLQETDGFPYLLVHGIFTGARVFRINQEQNGTHFDYRSRVYFRSTLRYHPNFNNNIQLDVLSRHLLRGRSPRQSFARSVSLRRFYNPGYVKNVAQSFKVPSQSGHWWSSRRKRRWFTKRSEKFQSQSNMKFLISRDLEVWFEEYFYSSLSQESLRNEAPRLSSSRYTIRPFLGDCSRMKGWRI